MQEAIETTTPLQRLVLLAVADLDTRGETPVRSFDVREFCESHADDLDGDPFGGGGVTRQGVIKALSALYDAGLLKEHVGDQSPVGKGRPAYALAADADAVFEALVADDHVGPLARSVTDEHD